MVTTRRYRRAGPGLVALGSVALIATTTHGAPVRPWVPPDCVAGPPAVEGHAGAWYRLDARLADGILVGQRATIGHVRVDDSRSLDLGPESFASGPVEGIVLIGDDDGARSRLSFIDPVAGCARPVGESDDIIRHATIAPSREAVYEHRIERGSRRDLGIWRRPLDPGIDPIRVLDPIAPDERFGPTWRTELSWSDDGSELVVQSCGEVACRVRLYDVVRRTTRTLARPDLGEVVGVAGDRLVGHGACRGLPCPLLSIDLAGGATTTLAPDGGQAVMGRDATGRPIVVFEADPAGQRLRRVAPDGRSAADLPGPADGRRLVPGPARAGSACDTPDGWLLFAADGRLPASGPLGPILRRIVDGRSAGLEEVLR